jgi:hypothetical protein
MQLLVEMGEFPARVFKKELAIKSERCGEEIEELGGEVNQDHGPVLMEKNGLIGNEELQFAEEPKSESQENGDCQEE